VWYHPTPDPQKAWLPGGVKIKKRVGFNEDSCCVGDVAVVQKGARKVMNGYRSRVVLLSKG
jgi:hypothetical protein